MLGDIGHQVPELARRVRGEQVGRQPQHVEVTICRYSPILHDFLHSKLDRASYPRKVLPAHSRRVCNRHHTSICAGLRCGVVNPAGGRRAPGRAAPQDRRSRRPSSGRSDRDCRTASACGLTIASGDPAATPISASSRSGASSSSRLGPANTIRPRSSTIASAAHSSASRACCSTSSSARCVLPLQPFEPGQQRLDDDRRQAFERLVHQQQRRVAHQRAADRQHLLLAARQLVAAVAPPLGQRREEIVDPCRASSAPGRCATGRFSSHGQRREDLALLRHEADAEPGAAIGRQRARSRARRIGSCRACSAVWPMIVASRVVLPTPLRPSTRERPAWRQRERDAFEHDRLAVAGAHAVERSRSAQRQLIGAPLAEIDLAHARIGGDLVGRPSTRTRPAPAR